MTLYKDIMLYFEKFIHVYGLNLSMLLPPLKVWTPKNLTDFANFGHPVSKSWLRPCLKTSLLMLIAPRILKMKITVDSDINLQNI